MLGVIENLRRRAHFDDLAVVHHHNPIRHGADHFEVVADDQIGEAEFGAEAVEEG
jgi:hypothetical protein